jgi:hypothetical protein
MALNSRSRIGEHRSLEVPDKLIALADEVIE